MSVWVQIAIGGGIAFISTLAGLFFGRKKTNAETEEIAAQTYRNLNKDLLDQLKSAKEDYRHDLELERTNFEIELNQVKKEYEAKLEADLAKKDAVFQTEMEKLRTAYETKIEALTDGFEDRIKILEDELDRYHKLEDKGKDIIDTVTNKLGAETVAAIINPKE